MSNFCIYYKDKFKYINEIPEINIVYRKQSLASVKATLNKYPDKRINIYIAEPEYFVQNHLWDYFFAIVEQNPEANFALLLKDYKDEYTKKIYEALNANKEQKVKYFFDVYISDWDTLNGYLELNPCDMYIVEDLCFQLEKVKMLLAKHNCRIRCFPNVAQSKWNKTPSIKKFFIRPEDIELYSNWIDVFEFWENSKSIETIYRIYAKDKKWSGKLSELIASFDDDVNNMCIDKMFAWRRSNCEKRCMTGRPCRICNGIKELANTLEEHKLIIKN